jgi:hypothetical protein
MKIHIPAAGLGAAFALPLPALAAGSPQHSGGSQHPSAA